MNLLDLKIERIMLILKALEMRMKYLKKMMEMNFKTIRKSSN